MSHMKVKSLLKGLRYISQIFDDSREPEMQIGYPTDVKHVAHIGWESPSVSSPSWMKEYQCAPGFSSAPLSPICDRETLPPKCSSHDLRRSGLVNDVTMDPEDTKPRPSRHRRTYDNGQAVPAVPKQSRRHKHSGIDVSDSSAKQNRRHQKSNGTGDGTQAKQSRRKKSKDSTVGEGSSGTPRMTASSSSSVNSKEDNIGKCSDQKTAAAEDL